MASSELPRLSERELMLLGALPAPADTGMTGVQITSRYAVPVYPEIDQLCDMGLAQRRGKYLARTPDGERWLRENVQGWHSGRQHVAP